MKIATFNANSIRQRLDIVINWLGDNKPDVLCIQETKVQDHEFPIDSIKNAGFNCVFKGQKSYNGVAVISPHNIENVHFGLDDEPTDEPRIVAVRVKGIDIVNTYIPQGREMATEYFEYKLNWFNRLEKFFHNRYKSGDNVIWLGDLNVAPEDIDVYNPVGLKGHPCFNDDVSRAFYSIVKWGFVDLFRLHNNKAGQYTFWDYRNLGSKKWEIGWRIDHILATKPLAAKCKSCYVDIAPRKLEKPSDHTFLIAEFDV